MPNASGHTSSLAHNGYPAPIEDYAMIGDCQTGALVGTDGSIDWMCLPRFDSASTFGALLGAPEQGRWLVAPVGGTRCTSREYDDGSFTLVTRWVTTTGEVEVVDFMPIGHRRADVVRRVRGIRGKVRMMQEIRLRFGYADALPWVRQAPEHADADAHDRVEQGRDDRRSRVVSRVEGPGEDDHQ